MSTMSGIAFSRFLIEARILATDRALLDPTDDTVLSVIDEVVGEKLGLLAHLDEWQRRQVIREYDLYDRRDAVRVATPGQLGVL